MNILKVENLNVFYGAIHALKGISFEVNKGETVSLIGTNGAGKTTTLKAISGLLPSQGEIQFMGKNLSGLSPFARARLGIAHSPEGRGVFSEMSVLENLELGAYTKRSKSEIAEDLEMCFALFPRLKERSKQAAGTLSGGEQQMLAISRALMIRPELLILDEPSLGLAPIIVQQIFSIIADLNKKGMTILLVEQNANMALKYSDRAYVLETGSILLSNDSKNLLNDEQIKRSYLGF